MKDVEKIQAIIQSNFPNNDAFIIGCRADNRINSFECCEYDIIVVKNGLADIKNMTNYLIKDINGLILEILILNENEFINYYNNLWLYESVPLDKSIFSSNKTKYLYYKREQLDKFRKSAIKYNSLQNAISLTKFKIMLQKGEINETFCSLLLKTMTITTLETYIMSILNDYPKPSHLKYQINMIKEKNLKERENIDKLLLYVSLERSNISTLTRSINSLEFFRQKITTGQLDLLLRKLAFFAKKSMYADGYLLVNHFITTQNFSFIELESYNKLLNYCMDVSNKEKITMLKEAEILFNINKNFINNNY